MSLIRGGVGDFGGQGFKVCELRFRLKVRAQAYSLGRFQGSLLFAISVQADLLQVGVRILVCRPAGVLTAFGQLARFCDHMFPCTTGAAMVCLTRVLSPADVMPKFASLKQAKLHLSQTSASFHR